MSRDFEAGWTFYCRQCGYLRQYTQEWEAVRASHNHIHPDDAVAVLSNTIPTSMLDALEALAEERS